MVNMLGRGFVNRYYEISREKDSFLCVGIDPTTRDIRQRYVVPPPLIKTRGSREGLKEFSLNVIDAVTPYAPVIKPNAQFLVYALCLTTSRRLLTRSMKAAA